MYRYELGRERAIVGCRVRKGSAEDAMQDLLQSGAVSYHAKDQRFRACTVKGCSRGMCVELHGWRSSHR